MAQVTLVPTPIGNLADITLRALEVLRSASRIAAEDTRHTRKLLAHYEISTPLTALHQHNEHARVQGLIQEVAAQNLHLAVVSDAGTPGISDPGYLVVQEALKQDVPVQVLPGAVAFVPALVASGLPCNRFVFEGFLPPKKGRQTRIQALAEDSRTVILYEGPHRIVKTLGQLAEWCGPQRQAVAARELTKLHETYVRGTLQELIAYFTANAPKGEFVLLVAGKDAAASKRNV